MKQKLSDNELQAASEIIDARLDDIVGQPAAKARIKDGLLGMLAEDGFMAPELYYAPPGIGKSHLLEAKKELVKTLTTNQDNPKGRKCIYFETGKGTQTPLTFFTKCLVPHVHDTDSVLFIDEAHEASKGVLNLLRTALEPKVARDCKIVRMGDEGEILWNPYRHSMVLATNEIDKIPVPLVGRMEVITLVTYTDDQISQILFRALAKSGIQFHEGSLMEISRCARGTARDMVNWCNAIRRDLAIKGKKTINKADVKEILMKRGVLPMGVTLNELNTLLLLERHGESQLNILACMNQRAVAEQREDERYLKMRGFLTVAQKRCLTVAGRDYLQSLRDEKYIAKAIAAHDGIAVS